MWATVKRRLRDLLGAPFQLVLVISFSLVAATTILIGAGVISRTIQDYLAEAMTERVNRDMQLAEALYNIRLQEISGAAHRLALDPLVVQGLAELTGDRSRALALIDRQIANKVAVQALAGNHLIAVLDGKGDLLAGRLISATGEQSTLEGTAANVHWADLPIVKAAVQQRTILAATEVMPAELLAEVNLADQARIPVLDTPRAAEALFDPREGQAGLTLIGATPIIGENGEIAGIVIAFHLFNNDFTLVDRIRDVAGVDTVTIFFGDLRVSTNVRTLDGQRAIGTRISEEVSQTVLGGAVPYVGAAFVVSENYITRYDPVRNHAGEVVGILYVGARQAAFTRLVNTFNEQVAVIALGTILATFLLAIPVSRAVTRPLQELRDLAEANRRVAQGDMSVRVPVRAGGDVGELASSFNTMLDELQATQDQLVHSEKLASLGQLAAGVAHELNNPLATVLLFSDILLRECGPDDPQRTDLEMIVKETRRCKGIVAALLDFARQNQVEAQPTDLNALIRQVLQVEQKRLGDIPITIVAELSPHLPEIEADPGQMHEVVANLVSNALEAMPMGGKLTVRTCPGPNGMVTLEVADTGMGISAEDQAKLFVPFYTTKPVGKGTGLGLAIVYGIIKMHRGQITVQSQVGKGAAFTVFLPIHLSPATQRLS